MSTATLDAPQVQNGSVSRSRRNRGAESTPKSMQVPSNVAAVRTPESIDYAAVVKEIMLIQTKNAVGTTRLVSNKAKQHVFALACKAVRSLLSLPPVKVVENGVEVERPARLDEATEKRVRDAMEDVWKSALLEFLTFGGKVTESDLRVTKNQPVTRLIKPENSTAKDAAGNAIYDLDVRLKLQAVVTRLPTNTQEAVFVATMGLERALHRLNNMKGLDDPNPSLKMSNGVARKNYTREEIREQEKVVAVHEWKLIQLKELLAFEQRQGLAIAALDADLASGKLDQDGYASARKAIESAVK